jgi:hypothetical protein
MSLDSEYLSANIVQEFKEDWAFLSASGLERAERDPWGYALHADIEPPSDPEKPLTDADRGTQIHSYLERILRGMPRGEALKLCHPDVFETCALIDITKLPAGTPEVVWVYNVYTETVRKLPNTGHRNYGKLEPGDIPGSTDLDAPPNARRPVRLIVDWKTGYESVPQAAGCAQLEFHTVAASVFYGEDEIDQAICRFDEEGRPYWDIHRMDFLAIANAKLRLRRIYDGVAEKRALRRSGVLPGLQDVQEGTQCRYCPARGACPRFAQEAAALARMGPQWLAGVASQLQTDADAAEWWSRIKIAEDVIDKVKLELRKRAEQKPFRVGTKVVAIKDVIRRRVDGEKAKEVIERLLGPEIAALCCETSASITGIQKACGEHADKVFDLLESEGAFKRSTVRELKAR